MDTMHIGLTGNGIVVETGERTSGDIDNTARAVPWSPPAPPPDHAPGAQQRSPSRLS
jgi:hypothetical protein